ncbi:MAG: hypothetical protein MK212_03260 [Saprospiraceae bacterium]|nr:hypothetical protein [Saprospiraceae bacterium]
MAKFRRSAPIQERRSNKGRLISMLIILIFLVVGMKFLFEQFINIPKASEIEVVFVEQNVYIISGDTTNYDNFTSVLLAKLQQTKENPLGVHIKIQIPKGKTVADVADIVQVINALNNNKIQTKFQITE